MDWTLEVVVVPVSDVDRAKAFYTEQLGFVLDHDVTPAPGVRIVQVTPPGSGCSVVFGTGAVPHMEPGSLKGLQLVVSNLPKAHATLTDRGVDAGEILVHGTGTWDGEADLNNVGFLHFTDPDGNAWTVQQITARG